jgi:hypothetical protein
MNLWQLLDGALLVVGIGLVVVGAAQIYPPAAWLVAGAALITLGVLPRRRG